MAATVLTFDASRRRALRRAATGGPGDILLFSGVRYDRAEERIPDPALSTAPPTDPSGGGNPPRRN